MPTDDIIPTLVRQASDAARDADALAQQGDLSAALDCYRKAIRLAPEEPRYHNNLGLTLARTGALDLAIASLREALRLAPMRTDILFNLALALAQADQHEAAAACYQELVRLQPGDAAAQTAYATSLARVGRSEAAEAAAQEAVRLNPDAAEALSLLGGLLLQRGDVTAAVEILFKALRIRPGHAGTRCNLGVALAALGRFEEALDAYRNVIEQRPDWAVVYFNLGTVLATLQRTDEAIAAFRTAVSLDRTLIPALQNLGALLSGKGEPDEAIDLYRQALRCVANHRDTLIHLAYALQATGQATEAVACYKQALRSGPLDPASHAGLIFAMDMDEQTSIRTSMKERRRWNRCHARFAPLRITPDRSPDKRLRIGYLSADFCRRSQAQFIEPVLRRHNKQQVEVVCYFHGPIEDDFTARFRSYADLWRDVKGLPPRDIAELIRHDAIDIAVELAGYTNPTLLQAMAYRPAPVQATGLGSLPTGLDAIDHVFADPIALPQTWRTLVPETVVDLPSWAAFDPPEGWPAPGPLPMLEHGVPTFGCLNRWTKISDRILAIWADLLASLPGSRLVLKDATLDRSAGQRRRVEAALASRGIGADRLLILGQTDHLSHVLVHRMIDVALDPYPQGGGITMMTALWMGVPTLSARSSAWSSSFGQSFLHQVGLHEFVADDLADYAARGRSVVSAPKRLAAIRSSLRDRLRRAPVSDAEGHTCAIETAYRRMWQAYCAQPGAIKALSGEREARST